MIICTGLAAGVCARASAAAAATISENKTANNFIDRMRRNARMGAPRRWRCPTHCKKQSPNNEMPRQSFTRSSDLRPYRALRRAFPAWYDTRADLKLAPLSSPSAETVLPLMSGKRAFLDLLKQEGVEIMFGNPGTTELPLMDAFATENELRYLLGLQEAAVVAMADGYAQASGKLAVVNLHVAPGLGNAMGMLYDAQKAGSSLLVTAGQHDQSFTFSEPLLWADLPTIARPLVKWSSEVRSLADLPRAVHRAAKTALAPPSGPVFLSLPADVLNAEGDIDLGAPSRVAPRLRGDQAAIEEAAALLAAAERPVLIAGDAMAQSGAHGELVALAELLGAPVWAEGVPSTASFPASHPLFRGAMVRLQTAIREILQQHDVLFSVGGDLFTLSLPSETEAMPSDLAIIQLDNDAWELGKNYPARVAILGDPKASLPELTAAVAARMSAAQKLRAGERLAATKRAI